MSFGKRIIQLRKSAERGFNNHGWLKSFHSFSFSPYYQSKEFRGMGSLRVINEDYVEPATGFGTHPHENFEIYSYILSGELEHKDSLDNVEILKRGDVQLTSAGSGVTHSEFNVHPKDRVHFLQIWVTPEKRGIDPSYQTKYFGDEDKLNRLLEFISPKSNGNSDTIAINQNFYCYASLLEYGKQVQFNLKDNRQAYIHVVNYEDKKQHLIVEAGQQQAELSNGDGAFIVLPDTKAGTLTFCGASPDPVEFLVFDIASPPPPKQTE
jgi:redox-sensitive bicupin YhaK (pirin superfamily)